MTDKEIIEMRQKWEDWIDKIGANLGDELIGQDIFNELSKIVDSNSKIQSPSTFHRWIRRNYIDSVTIRVLRLNDHDQRTISLQRLIKEISENPQVVSRDYFVSRYKKWMQDKGVADRDYDKFAKEGDKFICPKKLNDDIVTLDDVTSVIKPFRDQYVAHFDKNRKIEPLPTFDDIEKALKVIDIIFCKYYMFLKGGGMPTRKPVLQFDWKEPLRYPWIEMTEEEKKWRAENESNLTN